MVETRHVLVNEPGRPYVLEVNRDVTSRHEFERERQTFVDTLAHDLRNPLGAAKAQAQLMMRRIERDDKVNRESVLRGLESVIGSVNRMNGLIGEMMDAAHLRDGQPLELRIEAVNLVALAAAGVAGFDRLTPRHTLSLETTLDSLVGQWDRSRLERVLGNLLDNAVRYSPAGGNVVISVSSESTGDGTWAILSVSDEGLGIPADQVTSVFERYHRGRNVTGRITGTGIGLFGVKQIVEQHGGTIEVESREGMGSKLIVRLPVDP
jgi:signal transduction histidine kinase